MSVHVTWDNNDHTVLRYDFDGDWQWEEFQTAFRRAREMLETVGHIVDVIADFRTSSSVPTETLARLAYVGSSSPINLGNTILVGSNTFSMTTLALFRTFYSNVAHVFDTAYSLERARALLAKSGLRYPAMEIIKSA